MPILACWIVINFNVTYNNKLVTVLVISLQKLVSCQYFKESIRQPYCYLNYNWIGYDICLYCENLL